LAFDDSSKRALALSSVSVVTAEKSALRTFRIAPFETEIGPTMLVASPLSPG